VTTARSGAPSRARVAVVDHALSFPPLDLFSATRASFEIVWVVGPGAATDPRSSRLRERTGTVVELGADLASTCSELRSVGVEGVVTFADENYLLTARIAERLGVPGHSPEVAKILSSKVEQRRAFERAGLPGPRYCNFDPHQPAAGLEVVRSLDLPVVVKPDLGSASRGIQLVSDRGALAEVLSSVTAAVVVEELVPDGIPSTWHASYLSVESLVHGGEVTHVALTGRFPLADRFRETGNFLPAALPDSAHAEVLELASRAVAATGITDSAVHTEIKLAPSGPQLIEVNGRLGGRPVYLLREVSGVDLFEETLLLATGGRPSQSGIVPCSGVAFWLMLQPPLSAARLESAEGLDECARLPGVTAVDLHLRPGELIAHDLGTLSRVVSVHGLAADHGSVATVVAASRDLLRLSYLHDPPAPDPRGTLSAAPEPRRSCGAERCGP